MYKVLIAEDEMLVRMGIKTIVNWRKLNMEVIGDVCNGKEALAFFADDIQKSQQPNLVITDIKMPLMDGLKLIEEIKKKNSSCQFIVITCLEEFDLVRQALKMQVLDYILKFDMTAESMETVLLNAKKKMDAVQNQNLNSDIMERKEIQIKRILRDFILYHIYSVDHFKKVIKDKGISLFEDQMYIAKVQIQNYDFLRNNYQDENGGFVNEVILNIFNELIMSMSNSYVIEEKFGNYILLFSGKERMESEFAKKVSDFLQYVKETVCLYLNVDISCGVSSMGRGYECLEQLYIESNYSIQAIWFLKDKQVIFYDNLSEFQCTGWVQNNLRKLFSTVSLETTLEFEEKLKTFRCEPGKMIQDRQCLLNMLQEYCQALMQKRNWIMGTSKMLSFFQAMEKCERFSDVIAAYISLFDGFLQEEKDRDAFSPEIQLILTYIQNNYNKNISLNKLAKMTGYSTSYLGFIFKKEYGRTIGDYVNDVRIEKAKELLKTSKMYTYQIAECTGFADESYFSRTFKRYAGMSPSKYRRSNSGKHE